MPLSKIHSRSKPFFVFSIVHRCALCVMMTSLIYQPTNSVSKVTANPSPAQFTKQIQMHLHAHLSVCLSSKQKLAIAEWGRSISQFRLYNALGSDSRRSLSEIVVYVQKKPSSEMYKILCCQQSPLCIHHSCTASENLQRRRERESCWLTHSLTPCDGCCWMVVGVCCLHATEGRTNKPVIKL